MNFKYGIISEVTRGKARVFFEVDNFVTDWWPVLVRKSYSDKESWQFDINEHVVCLVDEHCETGVVLGAIYNGVDTPDPGEGPGKFRKLFSDGTFIEYDKRAGKMLVSVKGELSAKATGKVALDSQGDIEATAAGNATIRAAQVKATASGSAEVEAPNISLKGNVKVQGELSVTGTIKADSDITAIGKSLLTHIHGGVQNGGGVTGPPQ